MPLALQSIFSKSAWMKDKATRNAPSYAQFKFLLILDFSTIFVYHHCVESACIRSYSGPHFPPFGLNMERYRVPKNADQNNSEYGHFLCSTCHA